MDGSLLIANDSENDGTDFVDTSCLCVFFLAFDLFSLWALQPRELAPSCDRIMWSAIVARGIRHAHDPKPTVAFRSQYEIYYAAARETPPVGFKTTASVDRVTTQWENLPLSRRYGLLLGMGGVDDLAALASNGCRGTASSRSTSMWRTPSG